MCKVFGYARISTQKQSIERQIRNIKDAYPDAVIYQEAYTGTKASRPEWDKLLTRVKNQRGKGEEVTIIFDSVSRMSRNADEGVKQYMELYHLGVDLVFLKERHIDTMTYKEAITKGIPMTGSNVDFILEGINRYLMALAEDQIRLAFEQAQKEVDDLHKRTSEGIETARRAGKQIGQKEGAKLTTKKSIEMKAKIRKMAKSFDGNMSDLEVIETLGIARNTYYKYKKELIELLEESVNLLEEIVETM